MGILYYPESLVKKNTSPVEEMQRRSTILSVEASADLNVGSGLSYVFAPGAPCEILEIQLNFSAATQRNYEISKVWGRGILAGVNDRLWLKIAQYSEQAITIPAGFYTGTTLAAKIKDVLDANPDFVDAGASPFTVSYTGSSGVFGITANGSAGLQYFDINTCVPIFRKHSTAGPLIGLTANQSGTTILSDTPAYSLNVKNPISTQNSNTDLHVISTDVLVLDSDQGLGLTTSKVAINLDYKIVYKLL